MKLHDLRPAEGSHKARTRVGRGIAAGKGKTAGRGTKGQKARAGGSIPPWFEGGQTPLHMRIPKLRGFKNRFKIQYEVVNVGAISALAERGAFETEAPTGKGGKTVKVAQITINQDILRAVGLVRNMNRPLKILGAGELTQPLFVVADAFTASARTKIEAVGGSVNVLEVPVTSTPALKHDAAPSADTAVATAAPTTETTETATEPDATTEPKASAKPARKPKAAKASAEAAVVDDADESAVADEVEAPAAEAATEAIDADVDTTEAESGPTADSDDA
jgi:large subunit ribosomal protein L15